MSFIFVYTEVIRWEIKLSWSSECQTLPVITESVRYCTSGTRSAHNIEKEEGEENSEDHLEDAFWIHGLCFYTENLR